jgi:hypothetical protein
MKTLRDVNLPKTIVDTIPESVARECSVIAVAFSRDVLIIACPDECFDARDEERVRYILNRPISWLRLPRSEISDAIQRHYVVDGAIDDCGWRMRFQCPQRWRDLIPTDDDAIRYCNVCDRSVHACYTDESVAEHAAQSHCVAIMDGFGGVELIGDVGY